LLGDASKAKRQLRMVTADLVPDLVSEMMREI